MNGQVDRLQTWWKSSQCRTQHVTCSRSLGQINWK